MKTKLEIAKARKAKKQRESSDIAALVAEIKRFHEALQPEQPLDLTELHQQLSELPDILGKTLTTSLGGFLDALKTHLSNLKQKDTDLPKLLKELKVENKIDLSPIAKEIAGLKELALTKKVDQSQLASDYLPYRRVVKLGSRFFFDDNMTASGGGGGIALAKQAGVDYNYIDVQQTDADTETYVFKTGGSGGSTVQTITVNYTDSTKANIDNVSYT